MEQSSNKSLRLRRTQDQIHQLLEEFDRVNLSVSDFCVLHHISRTTFHKWQSRYERKAVGNSKPVGFVRLKIQTPDPNSPGVLFAEVHGIKLYQPVTASYLKELVVL